MGTTYRFIAHPNGPCEVISWFSGLPAPPEQIEVKGGFWLYFRECGALSYSSAGSIESRKSPLASVFLPRMRRGALWTVGEVHFLATPLKKLFPALHKISTAFGKWLATYECVFSNAPGYEGHWNYYLEGSVQNYDAPVFAFPSGIEALKAGQYFVSDRDNEAYLDKICSPLRLRGIQCDR